MRRVKCRTISTILFGANAGCPVGTNTDSEPVTSDGFKLQGWKLRNTFITVYIPLMETRRWCKILLFAFQNFWSDRCNAFILVSLALSPLNLVWDTIDFQITTSFYHSVKSRHVLYNEQRSWMSFVRSLNNVSYFILIGTFFCEKVFSHAKHSFSPCIHDWI